MVPPHVIAYSSHKLPPSAAISNTGPEKEMLAVIIALKEWRHFLLGRPFDLFSDNRAVTQFLRQPNLNPRQAR